MVNIKKGILVGLSSIILMGSVAPVVSAVSYVVVEGDTITSILEEYDLTLNELLVLNPELDGDLLHQLELEGRLDSYVISEGTKLEIDLGVLDAFVMRDTQTTNLDEDAHTNLDESVQSNNLEEVAHTNLDESVQSNNNEEDAHTNLEESVQFGNNDEDAHTDLDESVQSGNNEEDAHTDLDEAVQFGNNDEDAHTNLDESVQSVSEEVVQSIVDEWASLGNVETDSTYTIKSGDTAWSVANRNGLTLAQLYALNGGEAATASKFMRIGSVLVISGATNNTMSVPNTSNAQSSNNTSVVRGSVSLVGMNESAKLGSLEISNKYNVPIISALRAGDSQDHGKGLAADFGVPVSSAIGDEVAAYAVNNMDRLGITYVIWKQRIYGNWNRKWVMMEDRGSITQNHFDHVHVSYSGAGKSTVNEWTNPNKNIVNVYESVYEPKMDTTMDLPVYRVPNADMDLVYAIVQQEGGYSYESALWVMGTIMNRVNSSQFPNTIDGVIKQRGQFESYWAGHYKKHLGKIGPDVKRAVDDVINGKIVHDNLFFWSASYASMMGRRGVNVGGNVYFKVY